jgi:lauroyl/myristoyl acyltransferase
MYRLFLLASRIIPHLPRRFVMSLAGAIGFIAWLLASRARKQATANMLHVLGPEIKTTPAGRRRLRKTVRGMFTNNMRNYLEMFYLPLMTADELNRALRGIEGIEHLDKALALGKGVILVSAHIGPFNYLSQWFASKGYTVTIPVEHLQDERMLKLQLSLRGGHGVNFTPLGGSAPIRAIIQALRQNQLVLITGDRAVVGEHIERAFFGSTAKLPGGPVELAQRTGAVVLCAFGWREPGNLIGGIFLPVSLALPEEERKNADALESKVIEVMEKVIYAHPEQWVVFSPVWTKIL